MPAWLLAHGPPCAARLRPVQPVLEWTAAARPVSSEVLSVYLAGTKSVPLGVAAALLRHPQPLIIPAQALASHTDIGAQAVVPSASCTVACPG